MMRKSLVFEFLTVAKFFKNQIPTEIEFCKVLRQNLTLKFFLHVITMDTIDPVQLDESFY